MIRQYHPGLLPESVQGEGLRATGKAVSMSVEHRTESLGYTELDQKALQRDAAKPTLPDWNKWDSDKLRLEAPEGTPSPLREAYQGVAEALHCAWSVRYENSFRSSSEIFGEVHARPLSSAFRAAEGLLARHEVWLHANAKDAYETMGVAMDEVRRINHSAGHIMLAKGSLDAEKYLSGIPGIDIYTLLGRMRETTCQITHRLTLGPAAPAQANERRFMEMAIKEARQSVREDQRAHPKVGAVVVKNGEVLASAHRGELEAGEHAEYTALEKKLSDEAVAGATVYATLEPCTTRNHPKVPCAKRLIERRVQRVVIGMLDPNPAICGKGERLLRDHGIVVERFPHDLIVPLEELNRDFTRAQSHGMEGRTPKSADTLDHPRPEQRFREIADSELRPEAHRW